MKVAILTFQFAHNYGALLQAYALKKYIERMGHEAELAPYYPDWAQIEYAVNPFAAGIPVRKRARLLSRYPKRKKLAEIFDAFQRTDLRLGAAFETAQELEQYLNAFDTVIFGGDQIWNDNITGDTAAYYGGDITAERVSYAASLGTKKLSPVQEKYAKKYLPLFKAVSVREATSEKMLREIADKPVKTVTDPVFLLRDRDWAKIGTAIGIRDRFLLLYFLRDDPVLLDHAKEYARNKGLTIYEVHPTLARFHDGSTPLFNIGPREFVWLIRNAECVCTNSFHAVSFSVIFRKKLLHVPNAVSPERTISLLSYLGIDPAAKNDHVPVYDLALCDHALLDEAIAASKDFLRQAYGEERIKAGWA